MNQDRQQFIKVSKKALAALKLSRQKEGKILAKDLKKRLEYIRAGIKKIDHALPSIRNEKRKDVANRIQTAVQNLPLDTKRIEAEIALMLEKMDVTEELVRFKNHLQTFEKLMFGIEHSEKSVGRELDFTMQEMAREINTLGAKIGSAGISKTVVTIKSEMEKIREQVQNIE